MELDEVFAATLEAMKAIAPVGDIYAKAAEAMGGLDLQTRTAAATEKIADNTKKTNDLLRKGAGGLTFT